MRDLGRLASEWRRKDLLDVDELSRRELEIILEAASEMKELLARSEIPPLLSGTLVVNLFFEPSTRTMISFDRAARMLGAQIVNATAGALSVRKGESLLDTIKTLEGLGAGIIVMRHSSSGAPYLAARHTSSSVINAGDGTHAHPTQALLDLFTLKEHLADIEGRKIVIVGDILHSRVARSDIWAFAKFGAKLTLCAPPVLLPRRLEGFPPLEIAHDLDEALWGASAVIMLRMQFERMRGLPLPLDEYRRLYKLAPERLRKSDLLIMHPGPVNEGIEISSELVRSPNSLIHRQVQNGIPVRMAVLFLLRAGRREG